MKPLTDADIRDSLVNASQDEAMRMPLPGLHEVVWDDREYLGWRDPGSPQRGYLAYWRDGRPVGLVLRAAETRLRGGSAICSLCNTPQPSSQVTMFTAPRAGRAGERGDSVGTYICADLACSLLIRIAPPQYEMQPSPDEVVAGRAIRLASRLDAFVSRVLEHA
ncbi:FBP domain-containing protein [Lysinimonas soli]|uniref:FBP domain-containing protein n=1 Tax=Lysinimonas soli TaxID=1074233 RepID=A0ABW0NQS1_9MICO